MDLPELPVDGQKVIAMLGEKIGRLEADNAKLHVAITALVSERATADNAPAPAQSAESVES